MSMAVVARESEDRNLDPVDCTAPVMIELPREVLATPAPATDREEARIRVRIEPPRVIACEKNARSASACATRAAGFTPRAIHGS